MGGIRCYFLVLISLNCLNVWGNSRGNLRWDLVRLSSVSGEDNRFGNEGEGGNVLLRAKRSANKPESFSFSPQGRKIREVKPKKKFFQKEVQQAGRYYGGKVGEMKNEGHNRDWWKAHDIQHEKRTIYLERKAGESRRWNEEAAQKRRPPPRNNWVKPENSSYHFVPHNQVDKLQVPRESSEEGRRKGHHHKHKKHDKNGKGKHEEEKNKEAGEGGKSTTPPPEEVKKIHRRKFKMKKH